MCSPLLLFVKQDNIQALSIKSQNQLKSTILRLLVSGNPASHFEIVSWPRYSSRHVCGVSQDKRSIQSVWNNFLPQCTCVARDLYILCRSGKCTCSRGVGNKLANFKHATYNVHGWVDKPVSAPCTGQPTANQAEAACVKLAGVQLASLQELERIRQHRCKCSYGTTLQNIVDYGTMSTSSVPMYN